MKITKQARRDAKGLFVACRKEGVLDEARVRRVVTEVIRSRPRGYLAVLQHFSRLVKLDVARRTARVESAVPMSPALQQSIQQNLVRRYGPGLSLSFVENPALIAGLRVQVGSDVYDGSVASRLALLQETL